MRKATLIVVAIAALFVFANRPLAAADITVSPNIINIASASTVVTVHTDIPYWTVDASSVYLNDVLIQSWKSDDRGYFVAKFSSDAIKALEEVADAGENGTYVTLTLTGIAGGEEFSGTDEVRVINVTGKKK